MLKPLFTAALLSLSLVAGAESHLEAATRIAHKYPIVDGHIDRAIKLVGVEHVGLGSDFDGVGDTLPAGLKDASMYPNLIAEMLKRRYKEDAIARILGGNVLRVMEAVEQYAAKSKKGG